MTNCNFAEEYLRSISAVDSILNLDRMRQSVHLREEQMKNRPRNSMNRSFQQQNGGPSAVSSMGGFMRKTLSVPNISQLFISNSSSSTNLALVGGAQKLPYTNGAPTGPNFTSPSTNMSPGEGNLPFSGARRTRPIRSESLANLSGFTSPPGSSVTSPSQQSPQNPRPSSLSLGMTIIFFCKKISKI